MGQEKSTKDGNRYTNLSQMSSPLKESKLSKQEDSVSKIASHDVITDTNVNHNNEDNSASSIRHTIKREKENKIEYFCKKCMNAISESSGNYCHKCRSFIVDKKKDELKQSNLKVKSADDNILNAINKKLADLDARFEQEVAERAKQSAENWSPHRDPRKDKLATNQISCFKESDGLTAEKKCEVDSSVDEPVILTLSSDEDEVEEEKVTPPPTLALKASDRLDEKHPFLFGSGSSTSYKCSSNSESEEVEDRILLTARIVRVGNYRVLPKEKVKLNNGSFTFTLPTLIEGDEPAMLILKSHAFRKIRVHLQKEHNIFFLKLKPSAAVYVRRLLKMTNEQGLYLNPKSENETLKWITIVTEPAPFSFLETQKFAKLTNSKGQFVLEYIDLETTNEIMLKSTPTNDSEAMQRICRNQDSETLFIYPPPPAKGGITVTTDDYCCLEEGQFLNDVILDFYLKWLMLSKVGVQDRERIHVFSTFFYKRLTSKPKKEQRSHLTEDGHSLTPKQRRHARVRSWTKGVDLFAKDFIFIPINEHKHWFLAVVCFPGLDGPVRISDGKRISPIATTKRTSFKPKTPKTRKEVPLLDEGSERDEAEGDDEDLEEEEEVESDPPHKKIRSDYQPRKPSDNGDTDGLSTLPSHVKDSPDSPIKQPCILIFDSLPGRSRTNIVATLREYLAVEHLERKGVAKVFSKDTIKGTYLKVPQQMNFSDCGLFTLQFAQSFIEHPLKDFRFPFPSMADWFSQDVVASKRESIANLIRSLMDLYKPNHSIVLPFIHLVSFKANTPSTSSGFGLEDKHSSLISGGESSSGEDLLSPSKIEALLDDSDINKTSTQASRSNSPTPMNGGPFSFLASDSEDEEVKRNSFSVLDKSFYPEHKSGPSLQTSDDYLRSSLAKIRNREDVLRTKLKTSNHLKKNSTKDDSSLDRKEQLMDFLNEKASGSTFFNRKTPKFDR